MTEDRIKTHAIGNIADCKTIHFGKNPSSGGMPPTKAKFKAVRDWATPRDIRDVHFFLGFANHYWRLVKNFVAIANPLTSLTRKNV